MYVVDPDAVVKLMNVAVGGYRGVIGPTIAEEIAGNAAVLGQPKYTLSTGNRTTFVDGNVGERQTRFYEMKFSSDLTARTTFYLGQTRLKLNPYLDVSQRVHHWKHWHQLQVTTLELLVQRMLTT